MRSGTSTGSTESSTRRSTTGSTSLTSTDSPCWASAAPELLKQGCADGWWDRGVQRYPPVNAQDYADALAFLVRRYGDRVAGWEIWNEPNIDFYFKSTDQPADYARIVRAAYPAAKAADPSTTVIAGSLAESPAPFVEALFQHGIGGHFDAFSLHPYPATLRRWTRSRTSGSRTASCAACRRCARCC